MNSGIYAIVNKDNKKMYIGQSINIELRLKEHFRTLGNDTHCNRYLQRSYNKYGDKSFETTVLELCTEDMLSEKEVYYIKKYDSNNPENGYNMTDGGEGSVGFRHTEETKKKISKLQVGRRLTDEWKQNISNAHKGKMPKNIDLLLENNKDLTIDILQFDSSGSLVKEWHGINECSRELNIIATNLVKVLKGKHKTINGLTFVYKDEYIDGTVTKKDIVARFIEARPVRDSIVRLDKNFNYIDEKTSITAYVKLGYCKNKIARCCKGLISEYNNLVWMYKKDYNIRFEEGKGRNQENKFILN